MKNYQKVDLHFHSTASDGDWDVPTLVNHALGHNIQLLALTDHDTTSNQDYMRQACAQAQIDWVSGVEISVDYLNTTLHVVGLNFDLEDAPLQQLLERIRQIRWQRAKEIQQRLAQKMLPVDLDFSEDFPIGRANIADALRMQHGIKDRQTAFKDYLGQGKCAYAKVTWPPLEEAIAAIHRAGGVAVLAHPGHYQLSKNALRRLLDVFASMGGNAIEVISGSQPLSETPGMIKRAQDRHLAASTGSDFHSPDQPWRSLGRQAQLPEGVTPVWNLWQN